MILVGWMGAGSKGRDASVPAITEGREVRAGMILVGSMGTRSKGVMQMCMQLLCSVGRTGAYEGKDMAETVVVSQRM